MKELDESYTIRHHSLKEKGLKDKLKECFIEPKEQNEEKVYGSYTIEDTISMFTSEDLKKILSRVGQHTKVVMMDSLDAPSDSEKK
jgi:hypothetical protein